VSKYNDSPNKVESWRGICSSSAFRKVRNHEQAHHHSGLRDSGSQPRGLRQSQAGSRRALLRLGVRPQGSQEPGHQHGGARRGLLAVQETQEVVGGYNVQTP